MDLYNEIKIDFSGVTAMSNAMRAAYQDTARMRREIQNLQRDSQQVAKNLTLARMPALPTSGRTQSAASQAAASQAGMTTAQKAALFTTAGAGSAFFFRATQLANPAAMTRFTMAVEDATAVIGHRMIPALEAATRLVRQFGNFLANHPAVASGIGYGAIGLTGLALAGTAYQGIRFAGQGLKGIYNQGRGMLGFGQATTEAGMLAAGGAVGVGGAGLAMTSSRAQLARNQVAEMTARRAVEAPLYVQSYHAERRAQAAASAARAAERASGGLGASADIAASGMAAEEELAAIRAARSGRGGPPPLPSERGPGRMPPPLPKKKADAYGGLAAVPFAAIATGVGEAFEETFLPDRSKNPLWIDRQINNAIDLLGPKTADQVRSFGSNLGIYAGYTSKSSINAAARPAEYQDVLGSVLAMRQSIASGSATSEVSKDNTDAMKDLSSAIVDLTRQMQSLSSGESNRGTRG